MRDALDLAVLREWVRLSPPASAVRPPAPNLAGWDLGHGARVCATCVARLIGRGISLARLRGVGALRPLWADDAGPVDDCVACAPRHGLADAQG